MRLFSGCAILSSAILFSSCAVRPDLPEYSGLHVAQIVSRVKCELREAVLAHPEHHKWLFKWAAGFTLGLKVKERSGASASTDYVWPIPVGTFRLSFGGELTDDAMQYAEIKLSVELKQVVEYECPSATSEDTTTRHLTGDLGLADWVDRSIIAIAAAEAQDEFNGLGHKLEFFLQTKANAGGNWAILRFNGHKYNPTLGVSALKELTHNLDVALTKIAPKKSDAERVFVVNWPNKLLSDEEKKTQGPAILRFAPGGPDEPGVDPETQRKLDNILQGLQFRSLDLRD